MRQTHLEKQSDLYVIEIVSRSVYIAFNQRKCRVKKMIVTVTFNPSLDYVIDVDHFKTGEINRTKKENIYPGGKGINVSIVLKHLGIDNTAIGFTAGFTGNEIEKRLQEMRIQTDFIHVQNGLSRINVKMRSDSETEINGKGPDITNEDIAMLYEKLDALTEGDMLVLSGSIPQTLPETMYRDIMEHLKNKKLNIIVDASKELLTDTLIYRPFLIKPNHHELGEIYHTEIKTKEDALFYAGKLQKEGARNVLVSMAGQGAVMLSESGQKLEASAPKGTLKNSVGAGDSMVAGFLAGYVRERNERSAFQMGIAAGSASAFSEWLAEEAEIKQLLDHKNEWF